MNWGEFKLAIQAKGIVDATELDLIDWNCQDGGTAVGVDGKAVVLNGDSGEEESIEINEYGQPVDTDLALQELFARVDADHERRVRMMDAKNESPPGPAIPAELWMLWDADCLGGWVSADDGAEDVGRLGHLVAFNDAQAKEMAEWENKAYLLHCVPVRVK